MATEARLGKIREVAMSRQRGVVVLEDLRDFHNAGAVMRTCDAFGLQRVGLIFEKVRTFDPVVDCRDASVSTSLWLDFETSPTTEEMLSGLKSRGYTLVATALDDRAEDLNEADLSEPDIALLFGNEHRGLSAQAVEMADRVVRVPMGGMVQSLNLSVTAALVLSELNRQRRARGLGSYLLPEAEREALLARWIERRVEPPPKLRGSATSAKAARRRRGRPRHDPSD